LSGLEPAIAMNNINDFSSEAQSESFAGRDYI